MTASISMVEALLAQARSVGAPVIFLQNDGAEGATDEPFRPGWKLCFSPQPDEAVLRKKKDNGFDGTGLDQLLKLGGVRSVVICGLFSEMCVAATARGAMEYGYGVLFLTIHIAHTMFLPDPDRRACLQRLLPG